MKIVKDKSYAVVTGDIVKSSQLPPEEREKLPALMRWASDELRKVFGEFVPVDVDIFRGDSWQMLVNEPAKSMRCSLFYRAALKGKMTSKQFDTRMAIGVGTIDMLPDDRVTLGSGQAFELSGKGLDSMKRKQRACLNTPEVCPVIECLQTILLLIDTIASDWTNRQAFAVAGAMRGLTHEQIAASDDEKPVRQVITQHLDTAEWDAIEQGLITWEKAWPGINNK